MKESEEEHEKAISDERTSLEMRHVSEVTRLRMQFEEEVRVMD
jgi:hypothetical protein